jgi:uncharacterized protein (TIGR03067 family)
MVTRLCLYALCISLTTSALVQDDIEKEKKKMQGSWKVVAAQVDAVKIPLDAFKKVVVVIQHDKILFKDNGKVYDEIEFDIDPATKVKEIDYLYTAGLKKGVRERGIYKLDGDQLSICMAQSRQKRPEDFVSKKGTGQQLMVLKRIKS